jgi:hypothetical protein
MSVNAKMLRITNVFFNVLAFVDDLIIIQENEDDIENTMLQLNNFCKDCIIKISATRSQITAF